MKEVPFELGLLQFGLVPFEYERNDTGRRFNLCGGEYLEIQDKESAIYDYAQFGEVEFTYKSGVHRIQRVTILYGRTMEAPLMVCYS